MPELSPVDEINALAKDILDGKDPSPEQMHKVIERLRSERKSVSTTADGKRKTAAKPIDFAKLFASVKPDAGDTALKNKQAKEEKSDG